MTKLHNLNPEELLIFFYQEIQPFRSFNLETIFLQAYENSDFGVGGQIGGGVGSTVEEDVRPGLALYTADAQGNPFSQYSAVAIAGTKKRRPKT